MFMFMFMPLGSTKLRGWACYSTASFEKHTHKNQIIARIIHASNHEAHQRPPRDFLQTSNTASSLSYRFRAA